MENTDRILLEGLLFYGKHGASPEEKSMGHQFRVDVEIEADLSKARATDDLRDTIDYGEVYTTIKSVLEGPSRNLLERLADEIASRIITQFSPLAVRVKLTKPRLPLGGGVTHGVSVEVSKRNG